MTHQEKIDRIVGELRNNTEHKPISFIKKTVSHQVPKKFQSKNNSYKIDASDLNEIIEIDIKNKTCTAEPGITFSNLVSATLKYNLMPMVVPELKDITIGGVVAGCSVQATSYKYGGFHDNCLEYEILTADGQAIIADTKNQNSDLFEMVHGTFGTIGFISKLKFKLIKTKAFVKMKYETFVSLEEYSKAIEKHYRQKNTDFMDGIIFSPQKFVLCLGKFVNKAPYNNVYDWTKIYWKSVGELKEDYLKTYDYLFRYDAGCHWVGRNYGLENPIVRFALGKFLLPSTEMLSLGKKINAILPSKKPDIVVDIFTPISKWRKFWDFYLKKFDYFPLWVVPYRMEKTYPWINPKHVEGIKDKLYIDLAIYGMPEIDGHNHYRLMEEELLILPGFKTLISYNSFSKEEFWKIWNQKNYLAAKSKTDKDNLFGDLYKKTHRK
jgi:hypothetical protein